MLVTAVGPTREEAEESSAAPVPPFVEVYDTYFPFVWRSLQRLGVDVASLDDAVQEVFIVVHRRLGDFEGRSTLRTWIYGIALRVARAQRAKRSARRVVSDEIDVAAAPETERPDHVAENVQAARIVNRLLDDLEESQREVFVLAELEELPSPQIAELLGVGVNTVYSRLRLARSAFAAAAERHRAKDNWRMR